MERVGVAIFILNLQLIKHPDILKVVFQGKNFKLHLNLKFLRMLDLLVIRMPVNQHYYLSCLMQNLKLQIMSLQL